MTTRYLNGPAVDQILAEETIDDGETVDVLHMFTDHQGSVRDVTDNDGEIVDHIFYDSYGNPDGDDPAVQNTYGYAGYFVDTVTGLLRSRSRWYAPKIGGFMQQDPSQDGENWMIYVGANPTTYIDPEGMRRTILPGAPGNKPPEEGSIGPDDLKQGDTVVTVEDDGTMTSIGRGVPRTDALSFMEIRRVRIEKERAGGTGRARRETHRVQGVLGIVGMAPGFGDAVDVVDGGICLIRRDWTGVVLAFVRRCRLSVQYSDLSGRLARRAGHWLLDAAGGLATSVSKARETKRDVDAVSGAKCAMKDAAPPPRPKGAEES